MITGEGSYDAQSSAGKVAAHVTELAARAGVPVVLVAGRIAADADHSPFATTVSLSELAGSSAASLSAPARWLRHAGAETARRARSLIHCAVEIGAVTSPGGRPPHQLCDQLAMAGGVIRAFVVPQHIHRHSRILVCAKPRRRLARGER